MTFTYNAGTIRRNKGNETMNMPVTAHNKSEWSRLAKDAYSKGSHVKVVKPGKNKGRTGKVVSVSKAGVHKISFSTAGDSGSFRGSFLSKA